jgi:hypothetical protein
MAVTENFYTGNGSTTSYSFTFQYIDEDDIKVTLNGTLTTAYTLANATTVLFNSAPANGVAIRIYRDTNTDSLKSTFFAGSAIRAQDLNEDFLQNNYAVQEIQNYTWDNETQTIHSDEPWVSSDSQIATTAAIDARFQDELNETITSAEVWPDNDDTVATTAAIDNRIDSKIDAAITGDIGTDGTGITVTNDGDGTITLGLGTGTIDLDRIKDEDILTYAEQNAGSPSWDSDGRIATTYAAARRFDTLVQTSTPVGTNWAVGKTWLQNDANLTLSVWNGSAWLGIASGGTFTNQPKVVYVDATAGDDNNDGHRVSRPKATIKAAVNQINADAAYGEGSVVVVAPGVYQEVAPIDITKKDVSIIGQALRSCIVHPTAATETNSLFRLNSGSYIANLTLTGMKASGTRGNSTIDNDATYGLPENQGWNFSFYPGAMIYKSPYIQNCTNFSDSEINNSSLTPHTPAGGAGGDTDSAMTGGGLLIDGSTPHSTSPLRSMVCDSYTHVGLDGPGILVTNNGYCQATSSYSFFTHYHIKCRNGGQANLAASTTDFGRYSLVADGRSQNAIFTATTTALANSGSTTFTIGAPTAGSPWHGTATRPQSNMLVDIGGNTYPILSATAAGAGWTVTISRPDPANKSNNLGLNGSVAGGSAVSFYLRSMIASSGHTMEYVGSGTNYTALPENGGVPIEANQVIELNNGKVWAAITDHNGKFKLGDTLTVDQQIGFVTIPSGSIAFDLASDLSPQLGANLDVLNRTISSSTNNVRIDDTLEVNAGSAGTPAITFNGDTNTGIYSPGADQVAISTNGTQRLLIDSTGTISANSDVAVPNTKAYMVRDSGGTSRYAMYMSGSLSPSAGNDLFVGNTLNNNLIFYTNGTERVRVTNDGKLGLGTSSFNTGLLLQTAGGTSNGIGFLTSGTASVVWRLVQQGANDGSAGIMHGSSSARDFYIKSDGGGTANLLVDGKLGIGSISPDANSQLHVVGSSYQPLYINTTGTGGGGAAFLRSGTQALYVGTAGSSWLSGSSTADGLIRSEANLIFGIGNSERMRIDSSGRVGIGTTSPGYKLDVNAESNLNGIRIGLNGDTINSTTGGASALLAFQTNSTERARIDSSGRLLVGTSTSVGFGAGLQLFGTSTNGYAEIVRGAASGGGPGLILTKSRNTTPGSYTIVQSGDNLGQIDFNGDDGTDYATTGAQISCQVDGTPGANDMPGRLVFSTTADGASSPTERMRIANNGAISTVVPGGSTLYPAFACRAWVNFNGTGTVAIRASGNVSSIADNGVGNYSVNFTTGLADADFAVGLGGSQDGFNASTNSNIGTGGFGAGQISLLCRNNADTAYVDYATVTCGVFR